MLVVDQLNVEKLGIPTVTVVTAPFVGLAKVTAKAERMPDACIVGVFHPLGMIPPAEVESKAEKAFPEILKMATQSQPSADLVPVKTVYPAERFEFTGTAAEVNRLFFEKGWSLGLPVVPPTPERVGEMLRGTSRKPDEVLGQVPPQMATLTVELVAANAAMAGCEPEHMPLLIAALEGFLTTEAHWREVLATTATTQMVVIINGPIVKEIGIASGQGAAGKGHHPNVAIGYAINLIAYNVGGSRPPSVDKSTLASPADCVCWVFGENEDTLPPGWQPLHVDRGFKKSDSVVTLLSSYPPVENIDHGSSTIQEHLRWWSHIVSPLHIIPFGLAIPNALAGNPIVALGPEHAQFVASAGWGKDRFRQAFWEHVRVPLSACPGGSPDMKKLTEYLGPITPDSLIPVTFKPEQILVVLAGGAGKHSHYFPGFPTPVLAVSRLVTK